MRSLLALVLVTLVIALMPFGDAAAAQDEGRVVEFVISSTVSEDPPQPQPFGPQPLNFRARLMLLRQMASDAEVDGVALVMRGAPDFARCLDLADEIERLKQAGKTVVCYAEALTDTELMLASSADLLVMPPSGTLFLDGLVLESMYLKDMLAKIDVHVEQLSIGEYKTAFEEFTRDEMSPGQRETLEDLLDEFYGQMITSTARNRGLAVDAVEGLYAQLMVPADRAVEVGVLDAAEFHDQYEERVAELLGVESVEWVDDYGQESADLEALMANPFAMMSALPELLNPPPKKPPTEPYVAIVYATGQIVSGESKVDFYGNVSSMGSDTIVAALDRLVDDENCKAVVLRVNSPGGSALASDMILRAVERVQQGRPVISSMGYVAASGGYWISMGCDAIVAQPSTVTGSIGVAGVVPNVSQMLSNMGISVQTVSRGPLGDQLALLAHGLSPEVKDLLRQEMKGVYSDFVQKVAAGRGLPLEEVQALAKGRVWLGRQALENGLVDELGGLDDAVALACVMGGGLDPASTPLFELPEAPNVFEQLEKSMSGQTLLRDTVLSAAAELGWGGIARWADGLSRGPALGPDTVQCVLPFSVRVR